MAFTENKEFNSLTPEDIYVVSKRDKILLNRVLNDNLSSMAFVKKDEEGNYKIKPATHRDNKIIEQILNSNK